MSLRVTTGSLRVATKIAHPLERALRKIHRIASCGVINKPSSRQPHGNERSALAVESNDGPRAKKAKPYLFSGRIRAS